MKVPLFSCVEVINSKRQVNGKLGHVVQIQNYQHFQSPIQPAIRLAKNHFVDVLPSNHYLLTDFYLFTFALCRNRDFKPLYHLRVTQRTIAGHSELVVPTNGSFPSFKISRFQTEAKYKTFVVKTSLICITGAQTHSSLLETKL